MRSVWPALIGATALLLSTPVSGQGSEKIMARLCGDPSLQIPIPLRQPELPSKAGKCDMACHFGSNRRHLLDTVRDRG